MPGSGEKRKDVFNGVRRVSLGPLEPGTVKAAAVKFVDGGGPVLFNLGIFLIFWDLNWWNSNPAPTPSVNQVIGAVSTILSSGYPIGLFQYRGAANKAALVGHTVTDSDAPPFYPPGPPNRFDDGDIIQLIVRLIRNFRVPRPDSVSGGEVLYTVILPKGAAPADSSIVGEHGYFDGRFYDAIKYDGNVYFAWVENDGTLDSVTSTFSHEFAEACTDPVVGYGFVSDGPCGPDGKRCEIGDVCESTTGRVGSVLVQGYWSQFDGYCICPT